jgi:hypothetical protein
VARIKDTIASVRERGREDRKDTVALVVAVLVIGYLGIQLAVFLVSEGDFWVELLPAVWLTIQVVGSIALIALLGTALFWGVYLGAVLILALGAGVLQIVLHPRRFAANRRERHQAEREERERHQAEREERERRDQELLDAIEVVVVSVSNTEAVLSVHHNMPDLQDLTVMFDVSFLAEDGERVGWEYGTWWISGWEHRETVKRRTLGEGEPPVTSCDVNVEYPDAAKFY